MGLGLHPLKVKDEHWGQKMFRMRREAVVLAYSSVAWEVCKAHAESDEEVAFLDHVIDSVKVMAEQKAQEYYLVAGEHWGDKWKEFMPDPFEKCPEKDLEWERVKDGEGSIAEKVKKHFDLMTAKYHFFQSDKFLMEVCGALGEDVSTVYDRHCEACRDFFDRQGKAEIAIDRALKEVEESNQK